MSEYSENIKNYRVKANLTQKELADKIGVSFQTISKYENGINEPDLSTLKTMCVIFNCSLSQLVGENDLKDISNDKKTDDTTIKPTAAEQDKEHNISVVRVGRCADCKKELYSNDLHIHEMVRSLQGSNIKENVKVCNDCFIKHKQLEKEINTTDKTLKSIDENTGNKLGDFDVD